MSWLIITLLLIVTITILWVLFTPIVVMCDTVSNTYRVRQRGTFSAAIIPSEKIEVEFKILGMKFKPKRNQKTIKRKSKRKKRSWSASRSFSFVRRCMKGLLLKNLSMDLDTGDVILNAKLVPVAYFLTNADRNRFLSINFEGRVMMYLQAELRLYIILIAAVKYLLKQ